MVPGNFVKFLYSHSILVPSECILENSGSPICRKEGNLKIFNGEMHEENKRGKMGTFVKSGKRY